MLSRRPIHWLNHLPRSSLIRGTSFHGRKRRATRNLAALGLRAVGACAMTFHEEADSPLPARVWTIAAPGWLVSLVTHVAMLLVLALCYFNVGQQTLANILTAKP